MNPVVVFLPSPVLYVAALMAGLLNMLNVRVAYAVRVFRVHLVRRAAKGGIMVVVLSLLISVFVGAIIVNKFEGVIDDVRPGASTEFNDTADDITSNTWTVFIFLALGIIIVGAAWILRQTGLLG